LRDRSWRLLSPFNPVFSPQLGHERVKFAGLRTRYCFRHSFERYSNQLLILSRPACPDGPTITRRVRSPGFC